MGGLAEFIVRRNSKGSLQRLCRILKVAKERGAVVITDSRHAGVTMAPCVAWLTSSLQAASIRVTHRSMAGLWDVRRRERRVVFVFCNLWAMWPNRSAFARVKAGPWVALQTEHKGFRVYERAKCHYRWFLHRCDQVWDFGFDFCPKSHSIFMPTMWHPLRMMPPKMPTKSKDVVFLGICEGRTSDRPRVIRALRSNGCKIGFGNKLVLRDSLALYARSRIGLMMPRQPGNFEIHRFGAYAVSYTYIVAIAKGNLDKELAALLSPLVEFVKGPNAMVARVKALLQNKEELDEKILQGNRWFREEKMEDLVGQVWRGAQARLEEDPVATPQPKLVPPNPPSQRSHKSKDPSHPSKPSTKKLPKRPKGKILSKILRLSQKLR